MNDETRTVTELMAQLVQFYDYLRCLEIEKVHWASRPRADEWSLTEVMCHLRDVEIDVHQARFRAIISQDSPFLPGQDTDNWAVVRDYRAQDGLQAWYDFLAAREVTLTMLAGFATVDWQRSGRHSFLGQTTIQELVTMAVRHEREHREQIEALVADSTDFAA